jgi:hypothetical protein
MESKMYGVNPMKKAQAFDIGQDSFFKILSDKDLVQFIKCPPALDVLSSFFEDNDSPHAGFDASRALSSGIVRNFPSPASAFAKRSESASPCQSGDGTLSSEPEKDRQSSSIACRRSVRLMLWISDSANMGQI